MCGKRHQGIVGLVLGWFCLPGLYAGTCWAASAPPPASDAQPQIFSSLLGDYRQYGLPFPPADAQPVWLTIGMEVIEGPHEPALVLSVYHLAFLLPAPPGKMDGTVTLLVGTEKVQPSESTAKDWEPVDVRTETPRPPRGQLYPGLGVNSDAFVPGGEFHVNTHLAAAVQCFERGWLPLARLLLDHSLHAAYGERGTLFYQPARVPPRTALALLAWTWHANQLAAEGTDRRVALAAMHRVMAREPLLATASHREFLKAVEAALAPSQSPPGSAERWLDDLADQRLGFLGRLDDIHVAADASYRRLVEAGLSAVPALIAHLDDPRVTRTVRHHWGEVPERPSEFLRVGTIASDLVQEWAGDAGRAWRRSPTGGYLARADVERWWSETRQQPEEDYLVRSAVPRAGGEPYGVMLWRLRSHAPQRLGDVYQAALSSAAEVATATVVHHLMQSGLSRGQELRLLETGARSPRAGNQLDALRAMADLAPREFAACLAECLRRLPRTPPGAYLLCPESQLAGLAGSADDDAVWRELLRAAQRADAGLRLEILAQFTRSRPPARTQGRAIRLLAAFLDDDTVRDLQTDAQKFAYATDGWIGSAPIGEWVALRLAEQLAVDRPAGSPLDWTPAQWEELKAAVERKLSAGESEVLPSEVKR